MNRRQLAVAIAVLVAMLHVPIGAGATGPWHPFVTGYLIDILAPFAMVLVIGVSKIRWMQPLWRRAVAVFAVGAATESLQFFGVPIFGRTFDPIDYLAFAGGIAGAAIFERTVMRRLPRGSHERF